MQERNSEELAMHYQNVRTVFSITSSTATALILSASEKSLKEKADSDMLLQHLFEEVPHHM